MPDTRCRMLDVGCWCETYMDRKLARYRDLEIWKMARELAALVHKMSLEKLPKFEMYEEDSQIRRSAKSVSSNLVEGFGRRSYKNDYIKFLTYALASCDETIDHLGRATNFRVRTVNQHLASSIQPPI